MDIMNLKCFIKCTIIFIIMCLSVGLLFGCENVQHINEMVTVGDKEYYYGNDGNKIKNSLYNVNGKVYYFDNRGVKTKNDFVDYDGNKYYLDMIGNVSKGWKKINNDWYLFDKVDGKMLKGWQQDEKEWYYLDNNGIMQKEKWIDGVYYVDGLGKMCKNGWKKINNDWYLFDKVDGKMMKGWQQDENEWYYLDDNGIMQKEKWIDEIYYVDSLGRMCKNGWISINEKKCYFDNDGKYNRNMLIEMIFTNIPYSKGIWVGNSCVNIKKAYIKNDYITIEGNVASRSDGDSLDMTLYYQIKDSSGYIVRDSDTSLLHAKKTGVSFKENICDISTLDRGETYYFTIINIDNELTSSQKKIGDSVKWWY